jgi:hypothetical protein
MKSAGQRARRPRIARYDEAGARPDGCVIKGNINRQGNKIYHVPWGRGCEQTRIDECWSIIGLLVNDPNSYLNQEGFFFYLALTDSKQNYRS